MRRAGSKTRRVLRPAPPPVLPPGIPLPTSPPTPCPPQVCNVCTAPVVQQAWDAGQPLAVHGLVYTVSNGLLKCLYSEWGLWRRARRDIRLVGRSSQVVHTMSACWVATANPAAAHACTTVLPIDAHRVPRLASHSPTPSTPPPLPLPNPCSHRGRCHAAWLLPQDKLLLRQPRLGCGGARQLGQQQRQLTAQRDGRRRRAGQRGGVGTRWIHQGGAEEHGAAVAGRGAAQLRAVRRAEHAVLGTLCGACCAGHATLGHAARRAEQALACPHRTALRTLSGSLCLAHLMLSWRAVELARSRPDRRSLHTACLPTPPPLPSPAPSPCHYTTTTLPLFIT